MSKFGKKKKEVPAVNTSALPDIVFMLLFFFMVATKMRENDMLIEAPRLPTATEVKKLQHKSLVNTIFVGKAKNPRKYGTGDKIQLNDKIATVDDIPNFIYAQQDKKNPEEIPYMTNSIKADKKVSVGTIHDIREQLREVNSLKVSYSSGKGDPMSNLR